MKEDTSKPVVVSDVWMRHFTVPTQDGKGRRPAIVIYGHYLNTISGYAHYLVCHHCLNAYPIALSFANWLCKIYISQNLPTGSSPQNYAHGYIKTSEFTEAKAKSEQMGLNELRGNLWLAAGSYGLNGMCPHLSVYLNKDKYSLFTWSLEPIDVIV